MKMLAMKISPLLVEILPVPARRGLPLMLHVADCLLMFELSGRYDRCDIAKGVQVLKPLATSFVICNQLFSRVYILHAAIMKLFPHLVGSAWYGGGEDNCILVCNHGAGEAKAGVQEPANGEMLVVIMLLVMRLTLCLGCHPMMMDVGPAVLLAGSMCFLHDLF